MENIDIGIFKPVSSNIRPDVGLVLIAEPFMQGAYFSRSIILIVEHNEDGTVGFVLNKHTDLFPNELIEGISDFDGVLHIGGPVAPNSLHFIHTLGEKIPGSLKITDSVYWGGDFKYLKLLVKNGTANSNSVKFFGGYAGWTNGQLHKEIKENSWVVTSIDDKKIMQNGMDLLWSDCVEELGDSYKIWTITPVTPSLN